MRMEMGAKLAKAKEKRHFSAKPLEAKIMVVLNSLKGPSTISVEILPQNFSRKPQLTVKNRIFGHFGP